MRKPGSSAWSVLVLVWCLSIVEFTEAFRLFCDYILDGKSDIPISELGRFCYLGEYLMCECISYDDKMYKSVVKTKEDALSVLSQWQYYGGNWMSYVLAKQIMKILHGTSMQQTEINELIISHLWHGASWIQIKDLLYEFLSIEKSMVPVIFSRSIMALLSSNKFCHILQETELL